MDFSGLSISGGITFTTTVPAAPIIGTVTGASLTSANVPFTAPFDTGGSPITSYTAVSTPGNIVGVLSQAGSGTITVTGLTLGTSYTFVVYATNSNGNSANSAVSNSMVTATTPGAPTYSLSTTSISRAGLSNSVDSTIKQLTHGVYNTSTVKYAASSIQLIDQSEFVSLSTLTLPATFECWYYSVDPSVDRYAGILSVVGSNGQHFSIMGDLSSYYNDTTGAYGASTGGGGTLLTGWNHIAFYLTTTNHTLWVNGVQKIANANFLTSPQDYRQTTTRTGFVMGYGAYNTNNVSVHPTGYYSDIRVNSNDVYGVANGVISTPTTALTAISGTTQLDNGYLIGTQTAADRASLTITAPASNGGSAITSYEIFWDNGASLTVPSAGTYQITNLVPATLYTFVVRAVNAVGSGSFGSNATITLLGLPGAPTIGTATSASATTVTVTYTAPASNGGSAITSYTAVSTPGNISASVSQSGSGTITVTGLTQGTSYTFQVYATNGLGTSPYSSSSNAAIPAPPAYTWSVSTTDPIIAWYNSGTQYTVFAIPANSSSEGSTFWQYAPSPYTAWSNFGAASTYVAVSGGVKFNGVVYNGFVKSANWTTGNPTYEQRFASAIFGTKVTTGEVAARSNSAYTGPTA